MSHDSRFRPEPFHVAQQSRRDKLRVPQQQFLPFGGGGGGGNPSPSISQEAADFIYNCGGNGMLTSSGMMLDLGAAVAGLDHPSSSSAAGDWISSAAGGCHPFYDPSYHNAGGLEIGPGVEARPLKVELPGFSNETAVPAAAAGEGSALSLSLAAGFSCQDQLQQQPRLMTDARRALGPLGPFTGYAAVLKSSRFLRPAQQLLDEFCCVVTGSKFAKAQCELGDGRARALSSSSSSSFYSSTSSGYVGGCNQGLVYGSAAGGGDGGGASGAGGANVQQLAEEIQQKKVKLLYLQEEVCRRYRQYHQQMQMVVSSFESVAGLSAATPYASLALKAVSKNFRSVRHAISNQLRYVSRVLGEDFVSSPSSSSRGETITTTPRLKCIERSLRKQKASENTSLGFLDNNQPVWRPQRGLPERAVSVLRAWLFEHFLHPYPSDSDKHMLANQTGLSRNQVSNWFINARVRLWKPMVEEIHMLESKGMAEMDLNSSNKNDGKSIMDDIGGGQPDPTEQRSEGRSDKPVGCSASMDPMVANGSSSISMEQWHQGKRLRMAECTEPVGSINGGFVSFPNQGAMDIGGLGAVTLTLGLRHNEDPRLQQQQPLPMRHFESQMFHDFVG